MALQDTVTNLPSCVVTPDGLVIESKNDHKFGCCTIENIRSYFDPYSWKELKDLLLSQGFIEGYQSIQKTPLGTLRVKHNGKKAEVDGKTVFLLTATEIDFLCSDDKPCTQTSWFESPGDLAYYRFLSNLPVNDVLSVEFGLLSRLNVRTRNTAKLAYKLAHTELFSKYTECDRLLLSLNNEHYADVLRPTLCNDSSNISGDLMAASIIEKDYLGLSTSSWVQDNKNVFLSIPRSTLYVHKADLQHTILAVKPDVTEERLNKPVDQLINSPLNVIDSELSEIRAYYLAKVQRTGGCETFKYSHEWEATKYHWKKREFKFEVSVAYLNGYDECLVAIVDDEPSQRELWLAVA